MSTRSQVEFRVIQAYKDKQGTLQTSIARRTIYRHSDGYPEGILPDLIDFIQWNNDRMVDVEYTAANWIYYNKKRQEQYLLDYKTNKPVSWTSKDGNLNVKLGMGVCNNDELHGDIEYFYRVTVVSGSYDIFATTGAITIQCFRIKETPRKPDGSYDFDAPTEIEKQSFATIALNEEYEVVSKTGLKDDYSINEVIEA